MAEEDPIILTRLFIAHDAAAKAGLRDLYDWHQKVWKAFEGLIPANPAKGRQPKGTSPDAQQNPPPDFLTRLDEKDGGWQLLIVSSVRPHRPPWLPDLGTESWDSKEIPDGFFAHTAYRFQLLANPTKREKATGKRRPLIQREALLAWLERKAQAAGFRLPVLASVRTAPRGPQYFVKEKTGTHDKRLGLHHAVDFQGTIEVVDPILFRRTLRQGIGSAKSFGFGLLVLAPLS